MKTKALSKFIMGLPAGAKKAVLSLSDETREKFLYASVPGFFSGWLTGSVVYLVTQNMFFGSGAALGAQLATYGLTYYSSDKRHKNSDSENFTCK